MKIRDVYGLRATKGEIGVEVEVETEKGHNVFHSPYWRQEHDGSLRRNGLEYVLKKPVERDDLNDALNALEQFITPFKVLNTGNAGVHIHLNVQEWEMKDVYTFICLYLIVENLMVKFCGEDRESNHHCLRVQDAEAVLDYLTNAAQQGNYRIFDDDDIRYASLNLTALPRYGSLEFRSMRSDGDFDAIRTWVKLLISIKDSVKHFDSPQDVIESLSMQGHEEFLQKIFGDLLPYLWKKEDNRFCLLEGARNVQEVAYCCDWNEMAGMKRPEPAPVAPHQDLIFRMEVNDLGRPVMIPEPADLKAPNGF